MMMDLAKLPRRFASASVVGTPLWPAGHLPLKGGDRQDAPAPCLLTRYPMIKDAIVFLGQGDRRHRISPLEGEMPGRAEGGIR